MTLPGLWSRKSSRKEKRPEPARPSRVPETHWTRVKSKVCHRRARQVAGDTTSLDANMSTETPTDPPKRRLLFQIISPRPSVPAPRHPTTHRPSQNQVLSGNQAVNSRSYSQVPQDSPFSNFVSEYDLRSEARTRATTFGATPYAARPARALDRDENAVEHDETRCSEQLLPCELSSPCDPELLNASSRYEVEVPSECLRTGSMAQAHRRRLRAHICRARLVAEDLASPGFSLDNLSILDSASPAETDGVAVNNAGASASNTAESVVAAAPTAPDAGLYETSLESIIQTPPSDLQFTTQPSEFPETFDTETTNVDPTSRDSRASSSSSHSVFEFDQLLSNPAMTVENPVSLNPAEAKGVEYERCVYDPVHQWFSLEKRTTQDMTSSAEICERNVDSGWIESAGAKEESFVPVAPTPPARVSDPENGKMVTEVTSPTPPITLRPQYPQRHRSMNDAMIDPDSSNLTLPALRSSTTGSAKADGRDIGAERVSSAGEIESRSSFPAAPTPPTAVLRIKPCNMVILVTPPSPQNIIRPSLSHNYAKRLGMNPDDSHPVSHHHEPGSSTSQGGNSCLDSQKHVILEKRLPVKNYCRPFRPETDQEVGSAAYSRPADSEVFMSLIEGETESQSAVITNEMLSMSSPLGPSDETEEQLSFFNMLALGGRIDNADRTVNGVADMSVADEAEPSFSVEPVPTLLSRKSARVNRSTEKSTPRPVQHRVRALASRAASSLRKWGKAGSRCFVRRPAKPHGNTPFNPSFNPSEGFVPSRRHSLDCIGLNDALVLPQSDVWNISATD